MISTTRRTAFRIADDFALPCEAVTETFAILAKRGAGKTYTAMVMVEEMLAHSVPLVVIDPVGVWWGLRASAGGLSPGVPIAIFGGDHGDLPVDEAAGGRIADLAVDEHIPLLVDLSNLRKGEQERFVTDFAERLYHRNRQPLHLVLDEADAWAPQRPMRGQERMLAALEDLVRRGRAHGIGVTLVTQRAAVLNKNVLTQAEVLVALRTIAPQDRAAIDEWVRVHGSAELRDRLMTSLASLPVGTAWLWSPGWLNLLRRVAIRRRRTFDSSSTPRLGDPSRGASPVLAPVDLPKLNEQLARAKEQHPADPREEHQKQIPALRGGAGEGANPKRPVEAEASEWENRELASAVARLSLAIHRLQDALTIVAAALRGTGSGATELKSRSSRARIRST